MAPGTEGGGACSLAHTHRSQSPRSIARSLKPEMMLFFKNLVFTVLVPGTVAVWIPYWLLGPSGRLRLRHIAGLQWLGLVPWVLGVTVYFWCVWNCARIGRGT